MKQCSLILYNNMDFKIIIYKPIESIISDSSNVTSVDLILCTAI